MTKPLGWIVVHNELPLKTNLYPRRTAKLYSTLGSAKAAMANSEYNDILDQLEYIPVHYSKDNVIN